MHTAIFRHRASAALALTLAVLALPALAAPSTALLQRCAACHGATGNTAAAALYPNLAGQSAAYIELQLTNFRNGERPHAQMRAVAEQLTGPEMRELAAFYAAQPVKPQPSVDAALEQQGRRIFEHGGANGAPACASCHGPKGHGQAPFPRIASQPAGYTLEQLKVYRDAPRFNNPLATAMKQVAVKLNDADMRAVSAYLATLR
ncbi:c-type cytochrome [Massilia violaceinigra]|uniref:C-type cytochrome n=1 Tax=Massilia violaceinigra TaxID=2045208 RepID=A0ABY4A3Y8_9BURK|nr:c-type cytochrome [Massilia violaceinigra]UOD29496.1 c-type cytochrome [Massilia violaceinigra]